MWRCLFVCAVQPCGTWGLDLWDSWEVFVHPQQLFAANRCPANSVCLKNLGKLVPWILFSKYTVLVYIIGMSYVLQGIQQSNQSQISFCLRAEALSSMGLFLNYVCKQKKRGRRNFLHKRVTQSQRNRGDCSFGEIIKSSVVETLLYFIPVAGASLKLCCVVIQSCLLWARAELCPPDSRGPTAAQAGLRWGIWCRYLQVSFHLS